MSTRKPSISILVAVLFVVLGAVAHAAPKHLYLTYSGAPETSIDINIIFPKQVESVMLRYDTTGHGKDLEKYAHRVQATYFPTPMELSDRRSLYVATLTGLAPGTVYHFVVEEEKYGNSTPRKFKTLPGGTAPIRFVNGGDMDTDGLVLPLLSLAGKQNPDFAVLGGDIAYVNGLLGGHAAWDAWLRNWEERMVTTDGRMIPIVTAIGNHEVNRYDTTVQDLLAPWYISLFGRQGQEIYYARQFGDNLLLLALDSGHLNSHDGAQAAWLARTLETNKDVKYKVAAYHVPLYPAHRPYDGTGSKLGRSTWGPLFDEYGLSVGLEHHDHVLKRSKPLKGGKVSEEGTVYVGDGCFGRGARDIDPEPRWYNAVEISVPHFWVVDVSPTGMKFQAIDHNGKIRDKFSRH